MIIAIDGHDLEGNRTGVGQYLMAILRAWSQGGVFSQHRIVVFFKDRVPDDLPAGISAHLLPRFLGRSSTALFIHVFLPWALLRFRTDVLWCPGYIAPLLCPKPIVLTLHDIVFEARPELFNWRGPQDRLLLRFVARRAARRAMRILAPSEFTAREIMRCYRIEKRRIVLTREATDPAFHRVPDRHGVTERYGVSGPYFFFVGSLFTRRHIPECIAAFTSLACDFPKQQFLIAGKNYTSPHRDMNALIREANRQIGRNAVLHVPHVPQEDLAELYSNATALVWLSDYEGFGLPPLESLACETPVITTKQASLPETVGECALFVDNPSQYTEIAAHMRAMLTDDALRHRLIACGKDHAAKFSWEHCAAQTLIALTQNLTE